MAYIHIATLDYPVYEDAVRRAHPNTSWPAVFSPPEGYALVRPSVQPAHDSLTQAVREAAPVLSDGAYVQAWDVVALPVEEAAARAEAARRALVPAAVTMRQARLVLLGAGMLPTVNAAIAAMPGAQGEAARIEWEFSSEVKRAQPLVMALGGVLGLTSVQLDNLFVTAGAL